MAIVADLSLNFPQNGDVDKHMNEAPDPVWGGEPVAQQTVTALVGSTQSNAFNVRTVALRLTAKTNPVRYRVGPAPQVAVAATDTLLPTGALENIVVRAGWVIAAIRDGAADGELNVTELG